VALSTLTAAPQLAHIRAASALEALQVEQIIAASL
jgi:hypothetical protein